MQWTGSEQEYLPAKSSCSFSYHCGRLSNLKGKYYDTFSTAVNYPVLLCKYTHHNRLLNYTKWIKSANGPLAGCVLFIHLIISYVVFALYPSWSENAEQWVYCMPRRKLKLCMMVTNMYLLSSNSSLKNLSKYQVLIYTVHLRSIYVSNPLLIPSSPGRQSVCLTSCRLRTMSHYNTLLT